MLEFTETPWSSELVDQAREFFRSPAGSAVLTSLHEFYNRTLAAVAVQDFMAEGAAMKALATQSQARGIFLVLEQIDNMIAEKEEENAQE